MEYLSLGTIIDTFSFKGAVRVISTTDNAKKRYKKGNKVLLFNPTNNERKEITVFSYHSNGKFDIVQFDEIQNEEDALSLKGFEIQIIKDEKDLKEGYYFYSDLRGCTIIDKDGKSYGVVKEVEEFPAQITLRVKRENNKDFFVPFIKDFIVKVDIQNKQITVNIVEGMLWK